MCSSVYSSEMKVDTVVSEPKEQGWAKDKESIKMILLVVGRHVEKTKGEEEGKDERKGLVLGRRRTNQRIPLAIRVKCILGRPLPHRSP